MMMLFEMFFFNVFITGSFLFFVCVRFKMIGSVSVHKNSRIKKRMVPIIYLRQGVVHLQGGRHLLFYDCYFINIIFLCIVTEPALSRQMYKPLGMRFPVSSHPSQIAE